MSKSSANAERPATIPNLRLKQLVEQVLEQLPKPHTESVIEDVFFAIEGEPTWRSSYDRMVYECGKPAITSWAAFWISHAEKRTGEERKSASRGTLIDSYAPLVTPTGKLNKKVKEPEALKAMHDHFVAHRAELPPVIRDYRDMIVALIMDGVDTEVAFAKALDRPALAW
jgi:hypothetical protein